MFCMHVHMVEVKVGKLEEKEVIFEKPRPDCQARSIWKGAHDATYFSSQIYGSEILHTRSAWQFIPRFNTFFFCILSVFS